MRPRFSLRTLFILTALVAGLCYWLMLPSIRAKGFIRAVALKDFEGADAYFRDPKDRFLFERHEKHWHFKAWAELEPWSFKEMMRGKRPITLHVMYGDAGPIRGFTWNVVATRGGLLEPRAVWGGGGAGGGGIL